MAYILILFLSKRSWNESKLGNKAVTALLLMHASVTTAINSLTCPRSRGLPVLLDQPCCKCNTVQLEINLCLCGSSMWTTPCSSLICAWDLGKGRFWGWLRYSFFPLGSLDMPAQQLSCYSGCLCCKFSILILPQYPLILENVFIIISFKKKKKRYFFLTIVRRFWTRCF